MTPETLEDQLRQVTRHFTARLPEEAVLTLGRDLARELARAHGDTPPRFPDLDPAKILLVDGLPRLEGGAPTGSIHEDLFCLGALLHRLATGEEGDVSWRLDGPPAAPLTTLLRRATLAGLTSSRPESRIPTAQAAVAALEAALTPEPAGEPPWPIFRGASDRRGARPTDAAWTSLTVVWDAAVGSVVASPVLTERLALALTADGRLVFVERQSGRPVHEQAVGTAAEGSPTLARRTVYVGTDDGTLVAVDLDLGTERFRARLGQMVRGSVLALDNAIIAGVVDAREAGAILALEPDTGKVVWRRRSAPVFSSPALFAPTSIVVGSDDGMLIAVETAKGSVLWSVKLGGRIRATPAVDAERIVVGDFSGRLSCLRGGDGAPLWTRELGSPIYSSASIASDLVVVGCHDGAIYGVALGTGEVSFRTPSRGPIVASPAVTGQRIAVPSTDGSLYLLDFTGQILHRQTLAPDGVQSSPALDGDTLVVGSPRGLHALRLTP